MTVPESKSAKTVESVLHVAYDRITPDTAYLGKGFRIDYI